MSQYLLLGRPHLWRRNVMIKWWELVWSYRTTLAINTRVSPVFDHLQKQRRETYIASTSTQELESQILTKQK